VGCSYVGFLINSLRTDDDVLQFKMNVSFFISRLA
jgi:hypothetical protein